MIQVLEKAYELGVTHFDTAEMYAGKNAAGEDRHNEVLVGKFLKKVGRDKVSSSKLHCVLQQTMTIKDLKESRVWYPCR